jgi:hypothetical protein
MAACVGSLPAPARAAKLAGLGEEDWAALCSMAEGLGVLPMLYSRVKEMGEPANVPANVFQQSRQAQFKCLGANLRVIRDVESILGKLAAHGLNCIVLKGPHLVSEAYESMAQRRVGADLDLLLHPEDIPPAIAVLGSLGYEPIDGIEGAKDVTLVNPAGILPIELHWTIELPTQGITVDLDGLWERSVRFQVGSIAAAGLSLDDLVLHLCLEATYHHGNWFQMGFRPLCDLAALTSRRSGEIRWATVANRAQTWGAASLVHMALWVLKSWEMAAVPEAILSELEPPEFDPAVSEMARELVLLQTRNPDQEMPWNLARMRAPLPLGEKARIAWRSRRGVREMADLIQKHGANAVRLLRPGGEAAAEADRINALVELKQRMDDLLTGQAGQIH